jgi:ABC-2 type transport system permease protein
MRRWLANVFRLGVKELSSLLSDKVLFAFIIYSFSFNIYSEATGIKTEIANAPVAIVDSDHSALSQRIRDGLLEPFFRAPASIDRSTVDSAMDFGTYAFVLDIPPRLEADAMRGRVPALQLNIDATAMTQAAVGDGYIASIVRQETASYLQSRGIESELPVRAVTRAFFNPNLESVWFHAIDAILENVTMIAILLVGAAVIRERERGTIEHLLVMPVRASEIAVAKIWANGLVVTVAAGLSLIFLVHQILAVPIAGSVPLFLAGIVVYLFAITSLGILIATIANTMAQFGLLSIPVFLTLNMLSGGPSPIESMPQPLQVVLQASPAMHFVNFAQSVLTRGSGLDVVWPQLAILSGLGAVFLGVALARFRSMLARSQ